MLWCDVIQLVDTSSSYINDIGDLIESGDIESEATKDIFADKQSIRQSEFYQANAAGLKPELMFVIRAIDYNNETKLKYNNKDYTIIRTYSKDNEHLELICSGIVGTEVR